MASGRSMAPPNYFSCEATARPLQLNLATATSNATTTAIATYPHQARRELGYERYLGHDLPELVFDLLLELVGHLRSRGFLLELRNRRLFVILFGGRTVFTESSGYPCAQLGRIGHGALASHTEARPPPGPPGEQFRVTGTHPVPHRRHRIGLHSGIPPSDALDDPAVTEDNGTGWQSLPLRIDRNCRRCRHRLLKGRQRVLVRFVRRVGGDGGEGRGGRDPASMLPLILGGRSGAPAVMAVMAVRAVMAARSNRALAGKVVLSRARGPNKPGAAPHREVAWGLGHPVS